MQGHRRLTGVWLLTLLLALLLWGNTCRGPKLQVDGKKAVKNDMDIDHSETGFPLLGNHARLACEACHGDNFSKTPQPLCSTCHQSPHNGYKKKKCEECHTAGSAFALVKFRHPQKDLWSWHDNRDCRSCHRDLAFQRAAIDCSRCHSDFHLGALGSDCQRCHKLPAWQVPRYNHLAAGLPRRGAHLALECGDCHRDRRSYRITPRPSECVSCHEKDYRGAAFPHGRYAAGSNCSECHNEDSFKYAHSPRWFNIQTGFMRGLDCSSCHKQQSDYMQYTCHDCHNQHANDNNGRCLDCHDGGFPGGD